MLGISGDDVESHIKFKSELDLPFQLLADEGNQVCFTLDILTPLPGAKDKTFCDAFHCMRVSACHAL